MVSVGDSHESRSAIHDPRSFSGKERTCPPTLMKQRICAAAQGAILTSKSFTSAGLVVVDVTLLPMVWSAAGIELEEAKYTLVCRYLFVARVSLNISQPCQLHASGSA